MKILILSCGTRNKVVQYFKKELERSGEVYATDCSELAPALYEADKYFIVPPMNQEGYLDIILEICKNNGINAVFSLIDPELSLLAKNKDKFLEVGTLPIISNFEIVEKCFDKYSFYELLSKNNINTVKSYIDKSLFYRDLAENKITFPVFLKPVCGSASININKVTNKEQIETLFHKYDNLMIQEYMDGNEYGVDVYVDLHSQKVVSLFAKKKIKMRAGETDKSVSVINDTLFKLVEKFVNKIGFFGMIDLDIFEKDGMFYISEVNPRFGGGYPHGYESGVNFPKLLINNLNGEMNENTIGAYESDIYMMKYNEVKIMKK
ncbi:MAG: ATP-grasp domain-containing protein [Culicoidibacterales bacterium]